MIFDLWRYRHYLWRNAFNEFKTRYAGTFLGVLWNVLFPLAQIIIFTLVFSKLMIARIPGLDSTSAFAVYLCSGIIPWSIFSDSITRGSNALLENAHYIKKLPMPEYIFVSKVIVGSTFSYFFSIIMLMIVLLFLGHPITLHWLLLPFVLVLMQFFSLGICLLFSCLSVFFKDISNILQLLVQIWMWITPIVYVEGIIEEPFSNMLKFNPLYWFFDSIRQIIVYGMTPHLENWVWMLGVIIISILLGGLVMRRMRTEIRDLI